MSIKKLFKTFLLILLISFSINTTHAQSDPEIPNELGTTVEPELFVGEIFFDKVSHEPGDIVNGVFQLHNIGQKAATNVRYGIELVELYDLNGFDMPAQPIDTSDKSEPFNVESGLQGLSFTYSLPLNIPTGKIGILVQMYDSEGIPSAMNYVPITISEAERQNFLKQYPVIVVGDDAPYDVQAGPTVEKEEPVIFVAGLQSAEENDLELFGEVSLYKGPSADNNSIFKDKTQNLILKSKELNSIQYEIPVKDLEPGVYTLIFQLKDTDGVIRGLPIEARFIMAGLLPKINNVSYNTSDFTNQEKFIVSVEYTDIPLNIRTDDKGVPVDPRAVVFDSKIDNATSPLLEGMSVEILITDDLTGQTISSQEKNFSDSSRVDVEFDTITDTASIRVDVTLKQNNQKIDVDSFSLAVNTGHSKPDNKILMYSIFGGIALLFVILISVFVIKKNKIKKEQINKISMIVLALLISTGSISVAIFSNEIKESSAMRAAGGVALYYTTVHSPKPPAVRKYRPGENMMFMAQNAWANCNNKGAAYVDGQATNPVPYGQAHTGYSQLASVLNDPEAVRRIPMTFCGFRGGRGGFAQGVPGQAGCTTIWINLPPHPYRTRYGIFSRPFIAPMVNGTYWFNYRIGAVGALGSLYDTGTVVFEVADNARDDICSDIEGIQTQLPEGRIQSIARTGQLTCPPGNTVAVSCSVSKRIIEIGETVVYTATTQKNSTFKWYAGNSALFRLIKTESARMVSTLSEAYSSPGIFQKTIRVENSDGVGQCTVGVTVRDPRTGLEGIGNAFTIVDEDGNVYGLNPNAGAGKINFDFNGELTNNVCQAEWSTENTLACWLYKNNERFEKIELSGRMDLQPGKYKIMCMQSKDGARIYSEEKSCLKNPDFREI